MEKIVFINGSPKKGRSMSDKLVWKLKEILYPQLEGSEISESLYIYGENDREDMLSEMYSADCIVLAAPLYVDALPAEVMQFMADAEDHYLDRFHGEKKPKLFLIVNCGLRECTQNETCVKITELFCKRAGLEFRGGMAIGSGALIMDSKRASYVEKFCEEIAEEILAVSRGEESEDRVDAPRVRYADAGMPQFLFISKSDKMWTDAAFKRGLTKRALKAKVYQEK